MKTQMRVQKILMLVSLVVAALVFVYALFFLTGGLGNVYRFIDKTDGDVIHCKNFVDTSQSFVSTLVVLGIVMIVLVAVMYLMACHTRRKYYVTNYVAIGAFVAFALVVAIYLVAMVATTMNLYQNNINWKSGEGRQMTRIINIPLKFEDAGDKYSFSANDMKENEEDVEKGDVLYVNDRTFKICYDVVEKEDGKKERSYNIFTADDFGNLIKDGVPDIGSTDWVDVHANYAEQAEFYPDYKLDPNQTYNFALGFVLFVIVFADAVCVTLCTVWKYLLVKGEKKLLANGDASVEENKGEVEPQAAKVVEEVALEENPVKEGE